MSESISQLHEKIDDVKETLYSIDKKLEVELVKVDARLDSIEKLDEEQNEQLRLHILGVQTLQKMHKEQQEFFDKRLQELEMPYKYVKQTGKIIKWGAGIAVSITAIITLLQTLGWM